MPVTLNRNATGVLRTARLICSENENKAPGPIATANEHAHHVSCRAGVVALVLVTGLFLIWLLRASYFAQMLPKGNEGFRVRYYKRGGHVRLGRVETGLLSRTPPTGTKRPI
jgi:hypothetical protein